MESIPVHDTAFVIAYYRAQQEAISEDPYAKLWLRPTLTEFANDFAKHVSPFDEVLHGLRNRYFLSELKKVTSEEACLFINIGAGFSMYPYLLPEHVSSIEIDLPEVVAYKKQAIKKFTSEGKIPKRKVEHMAVDITDLGQLEKFKQDIAHLTNKRIVILIEGVFFFLKKTEISQLLSFTNELQKTGDYTLCVSFNDTLQNETVFIRLKNYFTMSLNSDFNPFTTLAHSYYENVKGYFLKRKSSSYQLGKKLKVLPEDLIESQILNEYFYTLRKN